METNLLEENVSYLYKYKGSVPVGILGQIDDLIGVTEPGYKAQQMNSYLNVMTADKYLQFGPDKCKTMLVGNIKKEYDFLHTKLQVDTWKTTYTQEGNIIDTFIGKTDIEEVPDILYLGVAISCDGKNEKNIIHKQNKSFGTKKQIMNMVSDLGKYTIECGFIYLNSLLRGSILYGAKAMIDMKEKDFRKIEQIEEDQMRLLFDTTLNCSLHLLYLESGQVPARFQIKRMQLNMYQYILKQKESSLLYSMLMAQIEDPVKNDFYSTVCAILAEVNINQSQEEIKQMTQNQFKSLVKEKCKQAAFSNLIEKQKAGSKGRDIKYSFLEMADYLLPQARISIKDQRELFAIRSRTNPLGANMGKIEYCVTKCGEILNNSHIFQCPLLNKQNRNCGMDKVLNGCTTEKKECLKIWKENMNTINEYLGTQ